MVGAPPLRSGDLPFCCLPPAPVGYPLSAPFLLPHLLPPRGSGAVYALTPGAEIKVNTKYLLSPHFLKEMNKSAYS